MLFSAVAFGVIVTASVLTLVSLSKSLRGRLDGNANQAMIEERLADDIVSSSYSQQIAAYRYLEAPTRGGLAEFRDRGQQVSAGISPYLFREMPLSSRLKVEAIKEAHQDFDVAAQHVFDLLSSADSAAARARIGAVAEPGTILETADRGVGAYRGHL